MNSGSWRIEQKGITFDHDFGYHLPLFSSLNSKNRDQKSCLSARSQGGLISKPVISYYGSKSQQICKIVNFVHY